METRETSKSEPWDENWNTISFERVMFIEQVTEGRSCKLSILRERERKKGGNEKSRVSS